jgi:Patatin-like phospholipase
MALGARTHKPLPCLRAEYRDTPPTGMRLGIALSGGGIRSAAFNLGALQALQERNVLEHADYLAAVSGGNYIASALTISGAYHDPAYDDDKARWAHGSAEERYLRQHTNYLAPGAKGRVWLALNIVYGFVLNYLPFLLCAFIAGRLTGWILFDLLRLTDPLLDSLTLSSSDMLTGILGFAALCVVVAVLPVYYRRFKDDARPADYGESKTEGIVFKLLTLAVALAGIGLVLPLLAKLYGSASTFVLSTVFGASTQTFDTWPVRVAVAVMWLLVSLVLAAAALGLSRRLRARGLMMVLASLAAAGLLFVPLLTSLEYSIRHGLRSADDVLPVVAALIIVLYMAVRVHNRLYSLHQFYRERLNSAFALVRTRDDQGRAIADPISYDKPLYFSEIGKRLATSGCRLPKLIVCCAVNLTSDEVPVGRFAESFTFEHDHSGGRMFDYHDTTRFEKPGRIAGTRLTLPSIMAVSGAALSPLMGRFTHPPLRFLMAMTNVRLGVWIRNPLHRDFKENPDGATADAPGGWMRRWVRSVIDGWREPGALYVLREALGGTKSSQRFIYLTDGGHWENLGLVELLRRRCTHVLCFDASSDQAGGGLDIGRAIALARSELGVKIEIDPRPTMPADASGGDFSPDVAVRGSIQYPDPEQTARLVYARAVLSEQGSWDLLAYKSRDGHFPNHSVSQQMFTDEQFESYRALGYDAGVRALELLNIPQVLLQHQSQPVDGTNNGRVNGQPSADIRI